MQNMQIQLLILITQTTYKIISYILTTLIKSPSNNTSPNCYNTVISVEFTLKKPYLLTSNFNIKIYPY